MDFEIRFHPSESYLLAEVDGIRSFKTVVEVARAVFRQCMQDDFQKVIIDVRGLRGWLKPIESMKVITGEFKDLTDKGLQAAVIVDREIPRATSFFELVARNRGYNIKIYNELQPAIDWILRQ